LAGRITNYNLQITIEGKRKTMDGDWRLAFGCWLLARKITNYNLQITIGKTEGVFPPNRLNL